MVVASTTLILPANSAATLILVVHATGAASDDPSAGLQAHMIRDGIVDVAEFSIAVSVLAVLVPLAETLVLEMSALLGLEALVDRAVFDLARLGHLATVPSSPPEGQPWRLQLVSRQQMLSSVFIFNNQCTSRIISI